jgi:hypothetical protein
MVLRQLQLIYPQTRMPRLARNRRAARSVRATDDASQQLRQSHGLPIRPRGIQGRCTPDSSRSCCAAKIFCCV